MATNLSASVRLIKGSLSLAQSRTHSVAVDRLIEAGGSDAGFLGGELFLASLGGCLASNVIAAARARECTLDYLELQISGQESDSPKRFSAIDVTVDVAASSDGVQTPEAELDKLITIAERGCLVSNTLRDALKLSVKRLAAPSAVSV